MQDESPAENLETAVANEDLGKSLALKSLGDNAEHAKVSHDKCTSYSIQLPSQRAFSSFAVVKRVEIA